ncbi:hypothetical protein [Streptomyces sp. NPDC001492]
MAGVRGRQQRGRSANFDPEKVVRANVIFHPGDPLREKFESAVLGMGVSGNEVMRYALEKLRLDENGRPAGWPAQDQIAEAS